MAAEINVPIKLQIANLQDVTKSMRSELSTLRVDSTSYKKLAGVITDIERRIAALQVKASHPFINAKQFADAEKDVNAIEDDLYKLRIEAGKIKFGDLSLSTAQSNSLKEFDQKLTEIDQKIKKVSEDAKTAFLSSDTGKAWAEGKSDSQLKSMESITKAIEREVQTRKKQYDEAVKNEQDYKARMAASRKLSAWVKGGHELSEETMGDTYAKVFQTTGKNAGNFKAGGRNLLQDWLMNQFQLPKDVVETLVQNSGKAVVEAFKSLEGETDKLLKEEAAKSRANAAEQRKTTNSGRTYAEARMRAKADLDKTEKVQGVAQATIDQEARAQAELRAEYAATNQERQTAQTGMVQSAATALTTGAAFQQAENEVRGLHQSFQEGSETLERYNARISRLSGISNFINRYIGVYAIMRQVVSAVRDAFNNIKDLDKNITNIAVVTNMSQQELWGKIGEYTTIAQQYGVATKDVYTVSQIFYQQGLQTSQVMELTTETLKMAKIAGMEYSDAANAMTVAVRAFKIEMSEAQQVTDTYSALAAKFAVSSAEIANAMEKTASSAASVGMSLQSTSAFMSVMIQTTRESAQNIGSAMKSIISRYGEMKASPASLLNVDGEEVAFNKVDTALQSIGISIKDASGQFRNFDDVIMELAAKWDTLDNNTQRYIATIMAGNRQQSRFIALVSNYDELSRAISTADTAENASIVQVAKTMDSLETKAQQVQNAFSQIYLDLHIESGLKTIYDWLTNILKTIGKLGIVKGAVPALTGLIGLGTGTRSLIGTLQNRLRERSANIKVQNDEALKKIEEVRQAAEKELVTQWKVEVDQTSLQESKAQVDAATGTDKSPEPANTAIPVKVEEITQNPIQQQSTVPPKPISNDQLQQQTSGDSQNVDNSATGAAEAMNQLQQATEHASDSMNASGDVAVESADIVKSARTIEAEEVLANANDKLAETASALKLARANEIAARAAIQAAKKGDEAAQDRAASAAVVAKAELENARVAHLEQQRRVENAEAALREAKASDEARIADENEAEASKRASLAETFTNIKDGVKEAKDAFTAAGAQLKSNTKLMGGLTNTSMFFRMIGPMIAAAGAAHQDSSQDNILGHNIEISKIGTGFGNALSGAGTGFSMGMMTGNPIIGIIGGVIGAALNGIPAMIDGFTMTLQEKYNLQQEEFKKASDESLKAQAKVIDTKSQLDNLKKLQQAMYNSTDDMKAYTEAMNTLGQQYPELISTYDSMGNAVIELNSAESMLLNLRRESAYAAQEAAEKEAKTAQTKLDTYLLGLGQLEKYKNAIESSESGLGGIGLGDIGSAYIDLDNFIRENATTLGVSEPTDKKEQGWARQFFGWDLNKQGKLDFSVDQLLKAYDKLQMLADSQKNVLSTSNSNITRWDSTGRFLKELDNTNLTVEEKNKIADAGIFSDLQRAYVTQARDINYDNVEDWRTADQEAYEQAQENIATALATWLGNLSSSTVDKIIKNTSDLTQYRDADEVLKAVGIDKDAPENKTLVAAFQREFVESNQANRDRILSTIYSNDGKGTDLNSKLTGLVKLQGEDPQSLAQHIAWNFRKGVSTIISKYADYFTNQLVSINDLADSGYSSLANSRLNALYNLSDELNDLGGSSQNALFSTITNIDFSSVESLQSAINSAQQYSSTLTDNEEQAKVAEIVDTLTDSMNSLMFNIGTTAAALESKIAAAAKNIESLATANNAGLSFDAAMEAYNKLNAAFSNEINSFSDAFTFDFTKGKYVYNQKGLTLALEQQRKELDDYYAQLNKTIDNEAEAIGVLSDDGTSWSSSENYTKYFENYSTNFNDLITDSESWTDTDLSTQTWQQLLKEFNEAPEYAEKNWETFNEWLLKRAQTQRKAVEGATAAYTEQGRYEQYTYANNIDWGSLISGNGSDADKAMAAAMAKSMGGTMERLAKWAGDNQSFYKILVETFTWTLTDKKAQAQFRRQVENGNTAKVTNAYKDVVSNWSSVTEEQRKTLEDALGNDFEQVEQYLIKNDDGTNTYTLNWSELLAHKDGLSQAVQDTIEQTVAQIFDDAISMFSKGGDFFSKGTTSQADMESFANEMQKLFNSGYIVGKEWKNVSVGKIFEFDELTQTSKLTEEAWKVYIEGKKKELNALDYSEEEIQRILISTAAQQVDIEGFIKDARSMERGSRAREALKSQIQNWNIAKTGESLDDAILENYASAILRGGDFAVNLMREIANDRGEELSTDQIEAIYRAKINELNKAQETLLTVQIGHALDANTASILSALGVIKTDNHGIVTEVTTDIDELVKAHKSLYDQLSQAYGTTVADLNKAYAQVLNAQDRNDIDAISTMQNAMGMTYDALGEMLGKYGYSLEQWLANNQNLYEKIGGGKIRITDFTAFAKKMGWEPGSEEYTSAFKAYNDSLVELNQKTEKAIVEEVKSLSGAKAGDKINLTMLWTAIKDGITSEYKQMLEAYGATFENGILEIGANADIQGIISTVATLAQQNADLLPDQLAELRDTVSDYIKNITNLIKNGISGSMSEVEAQSLQTWATAQGLGQLDFTKTAEGLKLSEQSAISLYYTLSKIDKLQAKIVFDDLAESLKESNENYKSFSSLASHIDRIRDGTYATDGKTSTARLKQYQAELSVAQEILAARLTSEDDSFNFMSGDIPAAQKNPLNYIKNWSEAFKTIKEAFKVKKKGVKGGYIDYEDWYNIVNEMNNIAALGQDIEIAGIKLDGSLESAAALIQKGADSLTMVDTGEVKVNLGKFGVGLKSGADLMGKDVEAGIHQIAQTQVDMLDSMIKMLETVVAMEQLGDLDTDKDMVISVPEIVMTDPEGRLTGLNETTGFITQYSAQYEAIRNKIINMFPENENMDTALDQVTANGHTMRQILNASVEDLEAWNISAKDLSTLLTNLYQLSMSDEFDIDKPWESFLNIFQGMDWGDLVIGANGGSHQILLTDEGSYYIDYSSEAAIAKIKQVMPQWEKKKDEEITKEVQAIIDKKNANEPLTVKEEFLLRVLTGDITIETNKDGEKTGNYLVGGQSYSSYENAIAASSLFKIDTDGEIEVENGVARGTIKLSKGEIEVIADSTGNIQYQYNGKPCTDKKDAYHKAYEDMTGKSATTPGQDGSEIETSDYTTWAATEHLTVVPTVSVDGKKVDLQNDPTTRAAVEDFRNKADEEIQNALKKTGDGGYTVELDEGVVLSFDEKDITTDGKIDPAKIRKQIADSLGLDTALAGTIAEGIKTALGENGITIENLNITPSTATVDGELVVEPIAEASGTVTTLKVKAENTEAEGTITDAEISAMLDNASVEVTINDEDALSKLSNIQTSATNVEDSDPEVTVTAHTDIAQKALDDIVSALDKINSKEINITTHYDSTGTPPVTPPSSDLTDGSSATGNIGLAKATGTLMGELGPELVVSNGRYFVAGQNGAEFVNLDPDAIVFNHLQTEQLLKKGMSPTRGRAITNEHNAVAYAHGNVNGGPAMASAEAALSALRQLRSMWASLLSMSTKDLAGLGGSGGGGGGNNAAFINQLERWYNYLQEIATLEEKINREELRRSKIQSDMIPRGQDLVRSQLESLDALKQEVDTRTNLWQEQKKYLDQRIEESKNSPFASLYTMDESGQLKYKPGALQELSAMSGTDEFGKPNKSVQDQYKYITETLGIDAAYLQYDSSGNKIEFDDKGNPKDDAAYQAAVQAFWDRIEADRAENQSLVDSINESKDAILQAQAQQNEIMRAIEDNQISVENQVLDAIVDAREREIEELQKQRDAIEEASGALIDGLSEQLNKEREMYNNQQKSNELTGLQRRLSILQRSGGSASEIASLQQQITDKQQDAYFDAQQAQIDALQEASDAQLEKLDAQIDLMNEQLAYEKDNGLLWGQVAEIMKGSPEEIASFIAANNSEYWSQSPMQKEQSYREALFEAQQFVEFRERVEGGMTALINQYADTSTNDDKKPDANETTNTEGGNETSYNPDTSTPSVSEDGTDQQAEAAWIRKPKGAKGHYNPKSKKKPKKIYKHKFDENGVCVYCGYKKKDTKPGDSKPKDEVTIDRDTTADSVKQSLSEQLSARIGSDAIARGAVVDTFWDSVERNQAEMEGLYGSVRAKAFDGDLGGINNSTIFEKTEVILQFDKMSSDYDAKRAGQVVMDEMMRIAQKQSGSNRINRR